jgi:N-acetylglucosaminyldiphosphoundecaprenol N-acetyl-beta-D-mannosaminyltransferase
MTSSTTPNRLIDPLEWKKRISIGSLEVDALPRELLIELILRDALHASSTRAVATINAQFYVLAEGDFVFRDCLRRSEFVCADGVSIGMATRILAGRRVERLAGVELVEEICRLGARDSLRIFLFGGRPGSAKNLGDILRQRYPGIEIAGVCCPAVGFEKSAHSLAEALHEIAAARPHVVFVALGAPKQELFIDQYLRNLNVPVALGVGGSFEILTGITRRAPKAIQRVGMEWLYRLYQEPSRLWRRYILGNPRFLFLVGRYCWTGHRLKQSGRA